MTEEIKWKFKWTARSSRAAQLVAEDTKSDVRIAEEIGIAARTLERWKLHPEFAARVREIVDALRAAVLSQGIADRVNRIKRLNADWERMQAVQVARAKEHNEILEIRIEAARKFKEAQEAGIPTDGMIRPSDLPSIAAGGETGLLVRQPKLAANGTTVEEFAVDTALLREIRETERQAAKELGQWSESVNLKLSDSEADEILDKMIAAEAARMIAAKPTD